MEGLVRQSGRGEAERLATALAAATRGPGRASPPPSFGFSLSMIQPMAAGCTFSGDRTLSLGGGDSALGWGGGADAGALVAAGRDAAAPPSTGCMGDAAAVVYDPCDGGACEAPSSRPCGGTCVPPAVATVDLHSNHQQRTCISGECSSGQDEDTPRKQQQKRVVSSGSQQQQQQECTNPSGSLTAFAAAAGLLSNDALSRLRQDGRTAGAFCPPLLAAAVDPLLALSRPSAAAGVFSRPFVGIMRPLPPGPQLGPAMQPTAPGVPARKTTTHSRRRAARRPGPDTMRAALGDRAFYMMRAAMMRQRDQFQAQLFDLHRIVRVQQQLAVELTGAHASETAKYAAEAAALLSSGPRGERMAAAATAAAACPAPSCGTKRQREDQEQQQRPSRGRDDNTWGPLPPGGPRPVVSDDRGARAVASLPLHVSLMLNLPSQLRKGIASSAGATGAGAPAAPAAVAAAAADHFWAPRKTAGVRRPVASRYPSCAPGGGGCLPALSGDTTVAQPRPRGAAAAANKALRRAPAAAGGAAVSAPAAVFATATLAAPLHAVAAWQHDNRRVGPLTSQHTPSSAARRGPAAANSGGAPAPSCSGGSGAVIKPRALPAYARPPVQLPAAVQGPKPQIKSRSSSGRAPSVTSGGVLEGVPSGGKAWQEPAVHSTGGSARAAAALRAAAAAAAAPAASAPPGGRAAARSLGAVPAPFVSLQLPALSGQPSGSQSAPSINPFRPAPQLQPLAASQLMAGGVVASPAAAGPFGPPPHLMGFDPHTYWVQKHFGGGATAAAPSAAAAQLPAPSTVEIAAAPAAATPPRPSALGTSAAAAGPAPPSPPPSVVHWWHDPRAVFGDGPGLIDPNAACDAPPPMLAPLAAGTHGAHTPSKRPRGGSTDSGDSFARGGGGAAGNGAMPQGGSGSMLPPPIGGGGGRGLAFRAVERRAPPAKQPAGSRVWSSLPSRIESVDSDGNDASAGGGGTTARNNKRQRHRQRRGSGEGGGGGDREEGSQRTGDGSAFASAAAGILMSLSSGGAPA